MWTRDASHVASAALGAYAFSEIAARVVGDAVAPDTARWLTLVALAVVAATFALVARADARRARADAAEAERRARCDARFRAAVLERVARRDPSRDPEDATRVDCLAALAHVVDDGGCVSARRARALDPTPDLPPLLATPARREAARAFAAKASEARRIPKDDGPRKDAAGDGFARRVAPPASFTAEDVADGAVVLSRALAGRDDPIEVAVSTDVSRVLVSGTREALVGFEVASTTTRSSSSTTTTSAPPSFAAGGCSLDPRDGADRVARVAAMLIDLARAQASRVLREGEPRRVANEGRPCVVRLRLETGREKRRVLGVLGDAASRRERRDGNGNGNRGARRTRVGDSRDERVKRDATWFDVRLVASLVAPRDARRVPREEQKRAANGNHHGARFGGGTRVFVFVSRERRRRRRRRRARCVSDARGAGGNRVGARRVFQARARDRAGRGRRRVRVRVPPAGALRASFRRGRRRRRRRRVVPPGPETPGAVFPGEPRTVAP